MATKQIGKLKYNISKRGIAYKWGDGEIHRFAFQQPREEPEEDYAQQPYADDGYDQPYDDGYAQDGYYEEEYAQEDYPAGFLFDNAWVMWLALVVLPPLGIYILWKKRQYEQNVLIGISAVSAAWFILLLVLLFSGIFRGSDDTKINETGNVNPIPTATVMANIPTLKPTTAPTMAPTATPAPTPKPDSSLIGTGDGTTGLTNPVGTAEDPIVYTDTLGQYYHKESVCGGTTYSNAGVRSMAMGQGKTACPVCFGMGGDVTGDGAVVTGDTFYATSGGRWFHAEANTCNMSNGQPISRADAEARGQYACPKCLGVYSTAGGSNYHAIPGCRGMKNADIVTVAEAKYRNQTECEVCHGAIEDSNVYYHTTGGKNFHSDPNCQNMKNAVQTTRKAAVALGQTPCDECVGSSVGAVYYWNDGGKNYHSDSGCQNVTYKKKGSKAAAENQGKTACETCVGVATTGSGNKVYFTKDGQWYHIENDCKGMKDAVAGTVVQAKQYNKTPCPECIGTSSAKVYGRKDGTYYHIVSDCGGMKNASYITVETAKKAGLTACPECIGGGAAVTAPNAKPGYTSSGEKIEVYCTEGGSWYHAAATCTNMTGGKGTTIEKATKAGKTACPICLGATTSKTVFATKYGTYYHTNKSCSGMANPDTYNLATAAAAGKCACPVCIGAVDTKVYLTKDGESYHVKSNCSGMTGAQFVTLKNALALGKDMCTKCIGTDSELHKKYGAEIGGPGIVGNTTTGNTGSANTEDSGFTVYCTADGTYYHTDKHCGPMSGAKATTLTAAAKAGKQPCPDCVAASSENAVYCRSDSRYYHTNASCTGMVNASKVTVAIATANGKTACPTCAGGEIVGNTGSSSSTGSNATKVYCTVNGDYYHKSADSCGMVGAQATTIERAKTVHGKEPCPDCYDLNTSGSGSVLTSVFWNPNGVNFHLEDDCRGMKDAVEGTVAQAKAAGKTACSTCFNTDNSTRVFTTASDKYYHKKSVCNGEQKTITTTYTKAVQAGKKGCPTCTGSSESTDSSKVYATLTSVYYHSKANCSKEDLNGASAITAEKASSYGKTKCPTCY